MKGRFMTPLLLVASLVLGVASAAAIRDAFGAEPWTQAEQPTWGGAPTDSGGYRTPWPDRNPQYPYSYPDDGSRRTNDGARGAPRYDGSDVAPASRRDVDGFPDRDGRRVDGARVPADGYRDNLYDSGAGWYPGSTLPGTDVPEPWAESDPLAVPGGRRESFPSGDSRVESQTPAVSPEFRFRGDPEPGSSQWSRQEGVEGYRFRPLTGQEAERRVQTPGWRPLEPVGPDRGRQTPSAPAGLMDALTPPARTFGFEPPPRP